MQFAAPVTAAGGGNINLEQGWNKGWNAIAGSFTQITVAAGVIGAFLVAGAIVTYLWQRRRGSAQVGPLVITAIIGAILAGPAFVIPIFLKLIDAALNAFFNFLRSL